MSPAGFALSHENLWHALLISTFVIGSAYSLLFIVAAPGILGSHGVIYTDAARAWLSGGDPWSVGPPAAIFAGPPPMLLMFAPLTVLPDVVVRWLSVIVTAASGIWSIRRLGLPWYWLLYPQLFASVLLGHPEVVVLTLLVFGGAVSGLAAVIKPYGGLALLGERRWSAIVLALAVVMATALILPWARFIDELPKITATLVNQARGDSTFGSPLMLLAAVALLRVGYRRALWLATPLLWPYGQPIYRVMSIPAMSPLLAACWALPIPGMTLVGIVLEAGLLEVGRRRMLPRFLQLGVEMERPMSKLPA